MEDLGGMPQPRAQMDLRSMSAPGDLPSGQEDGAAFLLKSCVQSLARRPTPACVRSFGAGFPDSLRYLTLQTTTCSVETSADIDAFAVPFLQHGHPRHGLEAPQEQRR